MAAHGRTQHNPAVPIRRSSSPSSVIRPTGAAPVGSLSDRPYRGGRRRVGRTSPTSCATSGNEVPSRHHRARPRRDVLVRGHVHAHWWNARAVQRVQDLGRARGVGSGSAERLVVGPLSGGSRWIVGDCGDLDVRFEGPGLAARTPTTLTSSPAPRTSPKPSSSRAFLLVSVMITANLPARREICPGRRSTSTPGCHRRRPLKMGREAPDCGVSSGPAASVSGQP
jgi:hypothetical protein